MDEADGLAINFSSDPVAPPRKKKPQKRSAAPSQWTAPTSPASTSGPPASKKPRLGSALKRRDRDAGGEGGGGPKGGARSGGGGAPKDSSRPVLSSLFSHNPAVPELSLPERQPAGADVFSGCDFSELPLHPHLVANVCKALGGAEMTKVQQKAIPAVLSGADCLIRAQTGSGKTLSYLLPIIQALQAEEPPVTRESGLFALVVVPTRELALQTHSCAASLMKTFVRLVPGYLSGGEKTLSEKRRLRRGLNLLVATPGRLLAHIAASRNLRLSRLRWLVLDEADLLLDMGYERDVSSVLTAVQDQRAEEASSARLQTLLLSATLDDRVQKLAGLSLHEPTLIDVAGDGSAICGADGELVTPGQLRQFVAVVPAKLRVVTLATFILWKCSTREEGKLVVFMSTQDMVDYHACLLETCLPGRGGPDIRVFRLHGSLTQTERTGVFTEFRAAKTGVLVCTDVAARGVDLPRVRWTVQYTPPGRPADYVHRAGRTARGGSAGATLLLLTPAELPLLDTLSKAGLSVSDLSLEQILSSLVPEAGPRRSGAVEAAATQLQLTMEETVQQDRQLTQMARKAFTSLVRAYAAYPAETRRMLSVRSLHLGHYAKSLCLRETPTALGGWRPDPQSGAAAARKRGEKLPAGPGRPRVRIPQPSDLSEFQSGLEDAGTAPRKKKKKKGAR